MADDSLKSGKPKKVSRPRKAVAEKKSQSSAAKKVEPKKKFDKLEVKATKKAADVGLKQKIEDVASTKKIEQKKEEKVGKQAEPKKRQKDVFVSGKTTFIRQHEVKRNWVILDAKGRPLGRVAAMAASLLRGKHKVDFTPGVDCGDSVIIINCEEAILTGKKLSQKLYYRHSGYMGGLKKIAYSELMKKCPQKAMTMAVEGMLPKGALGSKMAKHLRTYKGSEHGHEAQKPLIFKF